MLRVSRKQSKTHRVRSRGLWPAGLPSDDDLVDRQDRPGGLGRKLDGPLLGHEQVQDAFVLGVERARVVLVLGRRSAGGRGTERTNPEL